MGFNIHYVCMFIGALHFHFFIQSVCLMIRAMNDTNLKSMEVLLDRDLETFGLKSQDSRSLVSSTFKPGMSINCFFGNSGVWLPVFSGGFSVGLSAACSAMMSPVAGQLFRLRRDTEGMGNMVIIGTS